MTAGRDPLCGHLWILSSYHPLHAVVSLLHLSRCHQPLLHDTTSATCRLVCQNGPAHYVLFVHAFAVCCVFSTCLLILTLACKFGVCIRSSRVAVFVCCCKNSRTSASSSPPPLCKNTPEGQRARSHREKCREFCRSVSCGIAVAIE